MSTLTKEDINGLVNLENGLVSRDVFVSDEVYAQELERLFARAWLFVGHEDRKSVV